jgi:hypothetical protein
MVLICADLSMQTVKHNQTRMKILGRKELNLDCPPHLKLARLFEVCLKM